MAPTKTATVTELEIVAFVDARAWAKWLAQHHARSPGIWMKIAKVASGTRSVTYAEAVEHALAWGWIDGRKRTFDAGAWLQQFARRRPRSVWSKINRDKALALIDAGRMQPSGLEEVERARKDGRWDRAYDAPSQMQVPEDLTAALAKNRRAAQFFAKLDAANRYAVLWRIQNAKRPETRARRIADTVAMCARGEKLHP